MLFVNFIFLVDADLLNSVLKGPFVRADYGIISVNFGVYHLLHPPLVPGLEADPTANTPSRHIPMPEMPSSKHTNLTQ